MCFDLCFLTLNFFCFSDICCGNRLADEDETDNAERKNHDFKATTYNTPISCDHCGRLIWGSKRHGVKCNACAFHCHQECEKLAKSCGMVIFTLKPKTKSVEKQNIKYLRQQQQ